MNKWFKSTIAAGLLLVIAACGGGAADVGSDPYEDPGTAPPATIENPTVVPSMRLSAPDSDNLIEINVAGMAAAGTSALSTAQASDMFTVVEDGVVKGITVRETGGDGTVGADIAFVFDTTGSMFSQIAGARDSIIEFAGELEAAGMDVRLGAVTYGDAFDTLAVDSGSSGVSLADSVPPSFDTNERPTFDLTSNIADFQSFIGEQTARGGGTLAENGLGALHFAYQELDWRPEAQCILIVITDVYSWSDVNPGDGITDGRWYPPSADEVLADMSGDCVVHAIAPEYFSELNERYYDMADLTGVGATGGQFVDIGDLAGFDLTELEIGDVLTSGYVVTYRGTISGGEHTVRLVVDDGADMRGETTIEATY